MSTAHTVSNSDRIRQHFDRAVAFGTYILGAGLERHAHEEPPRRFAGLDKSSSPTVLNRVARRAVRPGDCPVLGEGAAQPPPPRVAVIVRLPPSPQRRRGAALVAHALQVRVPGAAAARSRPRICTLSRRWMFAHLLCPAMLRTPRKNRSRTIAVFLRQQYVAAFLPPKSDLVAVETSLLCPPHVRDAIHGVRAALAEAGGRRAGRGRRGGRAHRRHHADPDLALALLARAASQRRHAHPGAGRAPPSV